MFYTNIMKDIKFERKFNELESLRSLETSFSLLMARDSCAVRVNKNVVHAFILSSNKYSLRMIRRIDSVMRKYKYLNILNINIENGGGRIKDAVRTVKIINALAHELPHVNVTIKSDMGLSSAGFYYLLVTNCSFRLNPEGNYSFHCNSLPSSFPSVIDSFMSKSLNKNVLHALLIMNFACGAIDYLNRTKFGTYWVTLPIYEWVESVSAYSMMVKIPDIGSMTVFCPVETDEFNNTDGHITMMHLFNTGTAMILSDVNQHRVHLQALQLTEEN